MKGEIFENNLLKGQFFFLTYLDWRISFQTDQPDILYNIFQRPFSKYLLHTILFLLLTCCPFSTLLLKFEEFINKTWLLPDPQNY